MKLESIEIEPASVDDARDILSLQLLAYQSEAVRVVHRG